MLLAVDVGNTNIVFALFEGTDIKTRWRIATDARRTAKCFAPTRHDSQIKKPKSPRPEPRPLSACPCRPVR